VEGAPSDAATDTIEITDTAMPDTAVADIGATEVAIDTGPSTIGVIPPSRPAVAATGETRWFLVSKLYLGITDRTTGKADPSAWRSYGYDLDLRTTTPEDSKSGTNTCKRNAGSPTKVLQDGDLGRDNNFGQHFMAVVKSLKADAEESINAQIASGGVTMLLRLDNVGPDDNASVPGALFRTNPGAPPSFTEADHPSVDSTYVDGTKEATVRFPKGYMRFGIWVSGEGYGDAITVSMPSFGSSDSVAMPLPRAVMTFEVKTGKKGVIAGATSTEGLMKALDPSLKSAGICPGNATYDQVAQTMSQSRDLVLGKPDFQDTSVECSAISVAIGFDATPSGKFGSISSPPPPGTSMCF
jgi:hypothetical protein